MLRVLAAGFGGGKSDGCRQADLRKKRLTGGAQCHIEYGMKMTMHIDEGLLDRIVKAHGFASKTEAVNHALHEMDRKTRLKEFFKKGLGIEPAALRAGVDPDYDIMALRAAEPSSKYGKRRSR